MKTPLSVQSLWRSAHPQVPHVLIIYTGGTFGMAYNKAGVCSPMPLSDLKKRLPQLKDLNCDLSICSLMAIDSSDIAPAHWQALGRFLYAHYKRYDSFVILHGTDTMAYTASALSYMLSGLQKAVILTGAQVPIGSPNSDAKDNLMTALTMAAQQSPTRLPGVFIYFQKRLIRGNRATKINTSEWDAFRSPNYPLLAEIKDTITYFDEAIQADLHTKKTLEYAEGFETRILSLNFFPGCPVAPVHVLARELRPRAMVIHSYGSGNIQQSHEWMRFLKDQIQNQCVVLNQSQCLQAHVRPMYESGQQLARIGVLSAGDMTQEAALVKLMFLLAKHRHYKDTISAFLKPIAGEMTLNPS